MELEPKDDEPLFEKAKPFGSPSGTAAASPLDASGLIDPAEHNIVFTSLVTSDTDIVGLVSYSIYKQNKYDWLIAFNRQTGRMPNAEEVQSYLFGESTPRRLATYRHLADATLEGRGIDVPGSAARPTQRSAPAAAKSEIDRATHLQPGRPVLIAAIIVVLVVIGLIWFFHGGPVPK